MIELKRRDKRKKKNVQKFGGDFIGWNKTGTLDLGKKKNIKVEYIERYIDISLSKQYSHLCLLLHQRC